MMTTPADEHANDHRLAELGAQAVLGVLLGLIPIAAVVLQRGPTAIPFASPWSQLVAAAIALPLLIAIATSITSRPPRQLRAPMA